MRAAVTGRARIAWLAVVVATGTLLARGCGSEDETSGSPTPDGGATHDAAEDHDAGRDTTTEAPHDATEEPDVADSDACPTKPFPPDVPEGWEEYPIMDCKYRLYVPPSEAMLPGPLVWEPCTQDLGPGEDELECRQIKVDWPTELQAPYAIGGNAPAYVAADGKVVIQLRRVYLRDGDNGPETAYMALLAEADGPVRQAFWQDYYPYNEAPYVITQRGVAPGKSSWYITQWSGGTVVRHVAVGGDDTELRPPVLLDLPDDDPSAASVIAGRDYYVETGYSFRVRSWDGTDKGLAAQGAGGYSPPTWVGSTLLFAYESFPTYRVQRWTEQDGTKDLVAFPYDGTRGAGFPGSDGNDLVWIQGEGLGPTDNEYPIRSIMTSPFSTDPAEIQPRRLRSWVPTYVGTPVTAPVVGCGLAALGAFLPTTEPDPGGVLIVRLSDGHSWLIRPPPQPGPFWSWPIAITCDEVFTMFRGPNGVDTIRRVRLDSLGEGEPPD